MQLRAIPYRKAKHKREIRRLYSRAFPRQERLPFFLLSLSACMKGVSLSCYFDGDRFVGLTHETVHDGLCFVMFFAIEEQLRGQGYGSAVLSLLRECGACVVLNVEPLDPNADNYAQRVRRMQFYQRNGFFDTGYEIDEVGGTFAVLSTSPTIDTERYRGVFGRLSFGLWRPRIEPRTLTESKGE